MYYSSIGILALLILLINNIDILKISPHKKISPTNRTYRNFLQCLMLFYIADFIWSALYSLKLMRLLFIETTVFFVIMALTVYLWTQYVIAYLHTKNIFASILKYTGLIFIICQTLGLILNFFYPIVFWFDSEGVYHAASVRLLNLLVQFLLFLSVSIYTMFYTSSVQGTIRKRCRTIWTSSLTLAFFVAVQTFFPLMPFYSIGFMLATSLIHAFVQEAESAARREQLEKLLQVEEIQEAELGSARLMAYTDPLTGVKNKNAYIEDIDGIERRREDGVLKDFAIIVFDVNGLKIINDTKGHDAGDRFIKSACKIICQNFKHSPIYRIGGDEFVAFLLKEDFAKRNELLENFTRQIEKNKADGKVIIASGLAEFDPKLDDNYLRLFERADQKMYENKKQLKGLV